MCEILLNNDQYNARFLERQNNSDMVQQGNFKFRGRNAFSSVTFEFDRDMRFLRDLQSITICSNGLISINTQNVKSVRINDNNPQIVTFIL